MPEPTPTIDYADHAANVRECAAVWNRAIYPKICKALMAAADALDSAAALQSLSQGPTREQAEAAAMAVYHHDQDAFGEVPACKRMHAMTNLIDALWPAPAEPAAEKPEPGEVEQLRERVRQLESFKALVHSTLDEWGAPTCGEMECRVSGRLEWIDDELERLESERDSLRQQLAESERKAEAWRKLCDYIANLRQEFITAPQTVCSIGRANTCKAILNYANTIWPAPSPPPSESDKREMGQYLAELAKADAPNTGDAK